MTAVVATSRFQQKIFSLQPLTHFPRNTHDSRTKKAVTRQSFRSRPSPSPRALHYTREFQYKPKITKDRRITIVLPRWFAPITPPALNCTFAPMQPAARSHKHTRNTPPVQSEKKGTQNKTAQLLSVPHRPPRLSCPRWRHIAWHWTPSMRCVPPCRAHDTRRTTLATQTLLHSMHVASSLFRLPHERINMHETTQHTAHSASTHIHTHIHTKKCQHAFAH